MRALRRLDVIRGAASALGLALVLMVAAYGFASFELRPALAAVAAALAALVIAGGGLLYAFRLGAGGLVD
jgi:hypothetical protein